MSVSPLAVDAKASVELTLSGSGLLPTDRVWVVDGQSACPATTPSAGAAAAPSASATLAALDWPMTAPSGRCSCFCARFRREFSFFLPTDSRNCTSQLFWRSLAVSHVACRVPTGRICAVVHVLWWQPIIVHSRGPGPQCAGAICTVCGHDCARRR